jgi:uncharacterized DUF497 family protein
LGSTRSPTDRNFGNPEDGAMKIEFDEAKRRKTLEERGLDFGRASEVFEGPGFDLLDERFDYGEIRYLTFGQLDGRYVAIVWTPRKHSRRIISMRHVHEHEIESRKRSLE